MSAPATEDLRELERILLAAAELGEQRSVNDLREESGLDRDELLAGIEVLREHGKAVEVAPGEWRGPMQDEIDARAEDPPPVTVRTRDVAEESGEGVMAELAEPWAASPLPMTLAGRPAPTVRLTMRIAQALEPAALGALIKAGIDEASEEETTFVLEVVP